MPNIEFVSLFPILLGALLLFFGRKVFWLFVGAVAFMAALTFLPKYIQLQQPNLFYVALAIGAVAASAGVFLQRVALRAAGFLAGGYVFFGLWEKLVPNESLPWWLPFLIGGILGAVLLSFLFDWAMIILSSLTGAFLITQELTLERNFQLGLLIALTVLGIVVQLKMKLGKSKKEQLPLQRSALRNRLVAC